MATAASRVIAVVIVVFILFGDLSPRAYAQQTDLYQRVLEQYENGRFEDADSLIQIAGDADSLSIELVLLRAKVRVEQRKFASAASDFQRVLSTEPGHPEAAFGLKRLGTSLLPTTATSALRLKALVEASPDDLALRLQYADALALEVDYGEAIKQYIAYLDRTQASPQVLSDVLVTIANYGRSHALGEKIALKYTETYPSSDDLYMRLGYFRLWQGKFTDARSAFDRALEINPSNGQARKGLEAIAQTVQVTNAREARLTALVSDVEDSPDDYEKRFQLVDRLVGNGQLFDASQHLNFIRKRFADRKEIRSRALAEFEKIRTAPVGRVRSKVDRRYVLLLQEPENAGRQFSFVESLLERKRFYEAYDQLTQVTDSLKNSARWENLFMQADNGLIQTNGFSPVYAVDRLFHLLRMDPDDLAMRYALIDSLVVYDRYVEAMDLLIRIPESSENDMMKDQGYQGRLNSIATKQLEYAEKRIGELNQSLSGRTGAEADELQRELISHYVTVGNPELARAQFERLISLNPSDLELNLEWVEFLRTTEELELAAEEAALLLERFPDHVGVQKAYVLTHLRTEIDETTKTLLSTLISDTTLTDVGFLLEVATYFVDTRQIDAAEELLGKVEAAGDERTVSRSESVRQLLRRERTRIEEDGLFEQLNHARRLVVSKNYEAGIREYEKYFDARGIRNRDEVEELAEAYLADSNLVSALSMLEDLQNEAFTYDRGKEIARIKIMKGDFEGALRILDTLVSINPRDLEASLLQADGLKELGVYEEAQSILDQTAASARGSELLGERVASIESDIRRKLTERGQWVSYDFVGIIVPTAYSIHASGGGTEYDRRTEGLRAEVTLPAGAVVTAGFNSHFISGSRRLVPGSERVESRINQIFGSAFLDLTPPIRSEKASYTNRIFAEVGLYDYEGTRSVGYFKVRYWRQKKGKFLGSVGLRSDEGSIDLWSPGGGEFNLRLMQLDANGMYFAALPDSLLRIGGRLAVNVVSDNLGLPGGSRDRNVGLDLMLEASYKVIDHTYAGIAYYQLNYQSRTDTYFSPDQYEVTEFFLEYERESFSKWYVRLRGAIGAISRSSGSISQRLEADLIRRLTDNLSITLRSTVGEASRALGGGASSLFNVYNTFHLAGTVRWTL
ncbi:MAG: hypothetical protein BMS9Abin05_0411 [Rhodothermia bacterium]|nr:MAG: hypothetical protein BMS9Abin05_0411 [Rhodothermia bacterium]